jgi:hypothetical protein
VAQGVDPEFKPQYRKKKNPHKAGVGLMPVISGGDPEDCSSRPALAKS